MLGSLNRDSQLTEVYESHTDLSPFLAAQKRYVAKNFTNMIAALFPFIEYIFLMSIVLSATCSWQNLGNCFEKKSLFTVIHSIMTLGVTTDTSLVVVWICLALVCVWIVFALFVFKQAILPSMVGRKKISPEARKDSNGHEHDLPVLIVSYLKLLGSFGTIPLTLILFSVFDCTYISPHSVLEKDGIAILTQHCEVNCFTEEHTAIEIMSGLCLMIFVPFTIISAHIWPAITPELEIHSPRWFLLLSNIFQLSLVMLRTFLFRHPIPFLCVIIGLSTLRASILLFVERKGRRLSSEVGDLLPLSTVQKYLLEYVPSNVVWLNDWYRWTCPSYIVSAFLALVFHLADIGGCNKNSSDYADEISDSQKLAGVLAQVVILLVALGWIIAPCVIVFRRNTTELFRGKTQTQELAKQHFKRLLEHLTLNSPNEERSSDVLKKIGNNYHSDSDNDIWKEFSNYAQRENLSKKDKDKLGALLQLAQSWSNSHLMPKRKDICLFGSLFVIPIRYRCKDEVKPRL